VTVDAYMARCPGTPSQRSIQPVHLIALYLVFERDCGFGRAMKAMQGPQTASVTSLGEITVLEVRRAKGRAEHAERVERWARSVWGASSRFAGRRNR
jgi:hypothetical protein